MLNVNITGLSEKIKIIKKTHKIVNHAKQSVKKEMNPIPNELKKNQLFWNKWYPKGLCLKNSKNTWERGICEN